MLIGDTRIGPKVSSKGTKQEVAEGFVCICSNQAIVALRGPKIRS